MYTIPVIFAAGSSDCETNSDGMLIQPVTAFSSLAFSIAGNVAEVRAWQRPVEWVIVIAGIAAFSVAVLIAPGSTNILSISVTVALIASDVQLERSGGIARPWWVASLVAMTLAIVLFLLGRIGGPLGDPDSVFQGHGLWHALSAAALAFSFVATRTARTRREATK